MQNKVTALNIYPIKSTQAYPLQQANVTLQGLDADREYMLTELDGRFITARKDGELFKFKAIPQAEQLLIIHQDGSQLLVKTEDFKHQQKCQVWQDNFNSLTAKESINQWFSQKIGRPVQFRWLGKNSQRTLKKYPTNPLSFADAYPILLVSQASLSQLQQHCPAPLEMGQFRGNIVVSGTTAFAEESWHKIQIGEVTFLHTKPSTRCILTSRNLHTGELHPQLEPFRTLKKFHTNTQGEPVFGINLLPLNSGVINVECEVKILE